MKKLLFAITLTVLSITTIVSCTKAKLEQKAEDFVIKIMTDGTWIVTNFAEGQNNITADFAGWEYQYYSNLTCEARKGTQKVAGTWNASTADQTITGQFPAGSPAPLEKLNGTWKIVKVDYTFAQFTQTKSGVDYKMELTKK
jgi:hypothetical protein